MTWLDGLGLSISSTKEIMPCLTTQFMHYSTIKAMRLLSKKDAINFISNQNPSKEIISLNGCNIVCDTKVEYICINVLCPFYLRFLRPNCLSFVTLHVRKKKLNRCFPYRQPPPKFFLCSASSWLRAAPDTKEQIHLSNRDQGWKITLAVKAPLLPLFSDFPSRRRVGTGGQGGHISAGMRNTLSRWWMINRRLHVGGKTKWCRLPLGWLHSRS